MITISLRFEEDMKKELDAMCDEMGMNLTTFFMIYAKKVLRDRRIPFDIAAPSAVSDDYELVSASGPGIEQTVGQMNSRTSSKPSEKAKGNIRGSTSKSAGKKS